ncbi:phosphonopyruvate decarboxylase-like [Plakobranchus ocellatus]|uniref:2-hydroxyacyl-CoA lyase 2 n=1 Tax=Plakobranchus ocellatus TaxID=259542 RepID=A0AAV3ZKN2_9GAST|nr:phosphonopyruvate decarboxylase-like [Plakobranchus ocellatus]
MIGMRTVCSVRKLGPLSAPVLHTLKVAGGMQQQQQQYQQTRIQQCQQQQQQLYHRRAGGADDHRRTIISVAPAADVKPARLGPEVFFKAVCDHGIQFFCGVPDSRLKDFCAYVTHNTTPQDHVITSNEGAAVGLASGYHLASGKVPMVYLQNSGLGNMVNPLMSLANPTVYSIPMLLLIGWRGEPGVKDEPQHLAQGAITEEMLACMGIPCEVLPKDETEMQELLSRATNYFEVNKGPYAVLVKTDTFSKYSLPKDETEPFPLTREEALVKVVDCLNDQDAVVGTTGMLSRELFEYRVLMNMGHARDFLTVGSMGHASSIALGIALHKPGRQVFCLDGDGAVLMHMGTMATIGQQGPGNLKHIIFNNGAHDSVGGQPTEAGNHDTFDLCSIARACGYREALVAVTPEEIEEKVRYLHKSQGPILLELKVKLGSRNDLGRPTRTTHENKSDFMDFLKV